MKKQSETKYLIRGLFIDTLFLKIGRAVFGESFNVCKRLKKASGKTFESVTKKVNKIKNPILYISIKPLFIKQEFQLNMTSKT